MLMIFLYRVFSCFNGIFNITVYLIFLIENRHAYPKMVLARTRCDEYQYEGIKVLDVSKWILNH